MQDNRSLATRLIKRVVLISIVGFSILAALLFHEYQEIAGHGDGNVADELLVEIVEEFGWIVIALFLAVILAILITIRQLLAPLLRISKEAEMLGPENLDVRLSGDDVPSEILPLVERVNDALDRLTEGYRLQREFTADVAHELRTPLAVMRSRLETGGDAADPAAMLSDLEGINRLVEQLLKSSQLDAFLVKRDQQADLHAVAAEVVADLAPVALTSGRRLALLGAQEQMPVAGSAEALYHAVRNLVENALRFAPTGTAVELSLSQGASVELAVSDAGPGVLPENREKLFQRFWRADGQKTKGAGLGLSIVAKIMKLHGGRVDYRDREGGGSVFILEFPGRRD